MTVTVAMYDAAYDHIGERLKALGLDVDVVTFDKTGRFQVGGGSAPPEEVEVDYLWLSSHINADKAGPTVFDMALACRRIDVLQTFNAGLDHPFYAKLAQKGVRILNSSAQGVAIAEYVIAQVMAVFHPIERQRRMQADKTWKVTPFREISRTNWLIVGFGPIGQALATRVKAFGAGVSVVRRTARESAPADRVGTMADLPAFAAEADVIVLACPLNPATRGIVDADFFRSVKQGALLVNIARGGLIVDEALIAALDAGQIETAVLDVFHTEPLPDSDPLWTHPKVRLTPHTSFAGDGGRGRWDQLFLDNIRRYARGEPLGQEVDTADLLAS